MYLAARPSRQRQQPGPPAPCPRTLPFVSTVSFGPVRTRRKEGRGGRTESELLQGAAESLGEHKVHEADFKSEPAAVRDEVLPAGVEEADGVDESGEEAGETAK